MYRNDKNRQSLLLDLAECIFNQIDLILFIVDKSAKIINANQYALDFVDYTIDQIVYKNWFDIFIPDLKREVRKKIISKCINNQIRPNRIVKIQLKNQNTAFVEFNYKIIRYHNEIFILVYGKDVTELYETRKRFRYLTENLPGVIFIKEIYKETRYVKWLYMNDKCREIYGYDRNDFLSGKIQPEDVLLEDDYEILDQVMKDLSEKRKSTFVCRVRTRDNQVRFIHEICVVIDEKPDKYIVEGFIYDVTNFKELQRLLCEVENKFQALVENSIVGVYIVDDDKYIYVNDVFAKIHNYNSASEVIGKHLSDIVHPNDLPLVRESIRKRLAGDESNANYIHSTLTKNGDVVNVEIYGSTMTYNNKKVVIGMVIDVTEKIRWQKFLEIRGKMSLQLATASEMSDLPKIIIESLSEFCHIDCSAIYFKKGVNFELACEYGVNDQTFLDQYRVISPNNHLSGIYNYLTLNKTPYYSRINNLYTSIQHVNFVPIIHSNSELIAILFIGSTRSIRMDSYFDHILSIIATQIADSIVRIRNEKKLLGNYKKLKKALADKDILIKEIHHRVKNNFQVMSSLFGMQKKYIKDPEIRCIFDQIRSRIQTMSIIHQILYDHDSFSNLSLKDYFRNLVTNLMSLYSSKLSDVEYELVLDINDCSNFPIYYVTPIGLIINEVVSNVFKHAFLNLESKGKIKFVFRCNRDNLLDFEIIDNGVGLSTDFNIDSEEKNHSFGVQLIKILSKSVFGKFIYQRLETGGTMFKFYIDKEKFERYSNGRKEKSFNS